MFIIYITSCHALDYKQHINQNNLDSSNRPLNKFDVLNFSHETDIGDVKAEMGHRVAMMGNVPPLDVGVRGTPAEVTQWARDCLDKGAPGGGMILSFGGGVSGGTPAENIDALIEAALEWGKRGTGAF